MREVTIAGFLLLLVIIARTDLKTMEIPDCFVVFILITGVISIRTMPGLSFMERILGIGAASIPLLILTVLIPGAFGGGDIKLVAASGLMLGWKCSLAALFLAVVFGGIYGSVVLLTGRKGRKDHFAFGPFLCLGMVIALFFGNQILSWYLRMCGL